MALNRLMHPRNIYKEKKPDFKRLAIKYPEFRQHAITDLQGKVHLDFRKPECLRALSWALLKDDWGLDIDLPLDRLIPTIPLRLNYLLWLEDLINGQNDVHGIDIGTGASCVYPLLGAKKNKWNFLASESDAYSHEFANKNVEKSNLQDSIKVVKVNNTTGLYDLVTSEGSEKTYAFCMSNPPFFTNNLEAWGLTSRSDDRAEPKGINTAAPGESIAPGGEVEFVRKMIQDSVKLQHTVRIYTSMLGKKTSLVPLKEELRKHKIINFGVTEFCQGRTMRWGLGWSFDPSVKFPDPPSKAQKSTKPKPPVIYKVPHKMENQPDTDYSVPDIGSKVMSYLDELKVYYEPEKSTPTILEIEMVAVENTWSNQRRKRRAKRMHTEDWTPNKLPRSEDSGKVPETKNKAEQEKDSSKDSGCDISVDVTSTSSAADKDAAKDAKCDIATKQSNEDKNAAAAKKELDRLNMSIEDIEEYILKCKLVVKKVESDVVLEVTWGDGDNVELMHQVVQFFRNRLK